MVDPLECLEANARHRASERAGKAAPARASRRQFLGMAALAGAACLPAARLEGAPRPADEAMPVVDTHLHCFAGPDDERFPYHARAPYRPATAATPEQLLQCMDEAGVEHAIVVHPEPYQDDHRYLEHCLEVGGGRLKGTCLFFADRPESLARMPEFLRRNEGRIIAARLHAYAPGRLPPWGTPELRRLWSLAADFGIAMQLHFEPRYAPLLEPYLREFSDVPVILDHMGRPMQGTPEEHAVVVRWSELPQTMMKLSSLPRQDRYPHRDVQPVIRQLTDAFGPERMLYGGGFNAEATGASYRAYRETLRGYLGHLSATDQARILGGTAAQRFGFA